MAFITQQGILKFVLLHKFELPSRWIGANTNYLNTSIGEFLEFITESRSLNGSTGSHGFGEKP